MSSHTAAQTFFSRTTTTTVHRHILAETRSNTRTEVRTVVVEKHATTVTQQ